MMMSIDTPPCRLCGRASCGVVYDGPIRSGGAQSGAEEGYRVLGCADCGIVFLHPLPPALDEYYSGEDYWTDHHGPIDLAKLHRRHDPEQVRWFAEVGTRSIRGRRIADFGCGAGIFLDHALGIAAETIGVDASSVFADHLESRGHRFVSGNDRIEPGSIDLAVSFDTLEHVVDPHGFLGSIHRALAPDGVLFIGVPNQHDFLKELVPGYLPFFYHRSHLYYFDQISLARVLGDSGFTVLETRFVHKYDLMNMVVWARDGVGRGRVGSEVFDQRTEDDFRLDVERQGIASHLLIRAKRTER